MHEIAAGLCGTPGHPSGRLTKTGRPRSHASPTRWRRAWSSSTAPPTRRRRVTLVATRRSGRACRPSPGRPHHSLLACPQHACNSIATRGRASGLMSPPASWWPNLDQVHPSLSRRRPTARRHRGTDARRAFEVLFWIPRQRRLWQATCCSETKPAAFACSWTPGSAADRGAFFAGIRTTELPVERILPAHASRSSKMDARRSRARSTNVTPRRVAVGRAVARCWPARRPQPDIAVRLAEREHGVAIPRTG